MKNSIIEFQKILIKYLLSYAKNAFNNIFTQIFLIKIFSSTVLACKRINYFLILQQFCNAPNTRGSFFFGVIVRVCRDSEISVVTKSRCHTRISVARASRSCATEHLCRGPLYHDI